MTQALCNHPDFGEPLRGNRRDFSIRNAPLCGLAGLTFR
jgi:hypothetical protein